MRNPQGDLECCWWAGGQGFTFNTASWAMAPHPQPFLLNKQSQLCSLCNENVVYGLIFISNSMKPSTYSGLGSEPQTPNLQAPSPSYKLQQAKNIPIQICSYFHFLSQNLRLQYLKFKLGISRERLVIINELFIYSKLT